MLEASASLSFMSWPPLPTVISSNDDGAICQTSLPTFTFKARFEPSSMTLFFFPAMLHLRPLFETTTSGAPHCSRLTTCPFPKPEKAMTRTAQQQNLRGIMFDLFIFELPLHCNQFYLN